ncbi:unnamed protein product [Gongylonema pulchrum]|uniref:Lipoprotein n=1 Tax=Gongylonema pulchrum TaxID=637853 RepID=A0A183EPH1_9BILA|nr:unnamed protein product [Gongylonema pulchrum]
MLGCQALRKNVPTGPVQPEQQPAMVTPMMSSYQQQMPVVAGVDVVASVPPATEPQWNNAMPMAPAALPQQHMQPI